MCLYDQVPLYPPLSSTAFCVQIQKMVISGGHFRPDDLKAKEMVSLLLDDDDMETRCTSHALPL